MITSILNNLIHNAIIYTNFNGEVSLEIIKTETECQFVISDNGIGIEDETLKNIFNLEFTHLKLGTNKEIGTRLGLILVKEFVDKNNGLILIDSQINKGSKFTVIFPIT